MLDHPATTPVEGLTPEQAEVFARLSDPWWRLTSGMLYRIKGKAPAQQDDDEIEGLEMPFIPNAIQMKFLKNLHNRNIVLKARQHGMTTLIAILELDTALFNADHNAVVIAHTEDDATEIFRDKVRYAYERLPEALRAAFPLRKQTESQLVFGHNNSSIRVTVSARSGTAHVLHVSEMGKIAAKFPDKARELTTGSLQAVPLNGLCIIESTAEGQAGAFYELAKRAEDKWRAGKILTPQDYRFHFFGWWENPDYSLDPAHAALITVSLKDHEYFDGVEDLIGRAITPGQRAWYVAKRDEEFAHEPELMWREYPSCVVGETLVDGADGVEPIETISPDGQKITKHYVQGSKPVVLITTEMGYRVECTTDHPILRSDKTFASVVDGGIRVGQSLQLAAPAFGTEYQSVTYAPIPIAEAKVTIDERMGLFIGLFMGDGSFHKGCVSVVCDGQDDDVIATTCDLLNGYFGQPSTRRVGSAKGGVEVRVSRLDAIAPLAALGLIENRDCGYSWKRTVNVPRYIFKSKRSVVAAFLRGLFESDGYAHPNGASVRFFSKSEPFIKDVQLLLLMFGIPSWSVTKTRTIKGKQFTGFELRLRADGVRRFVDVIQFISKRKNDKVAKSQRKGRASHHNIKPFTWTDAVASIEPTGIKPVFDITTATSQFIANGIVVHNCPDECWRSSTEGKYLARVMARARAEGRIGKYPLMPGHAVYGFWDIGASDSQALWLMQRIHGIDRFVGFRESNGEGFLPFFTWVDQLGCSVGGMYLPHDASHKVNGIEQPTSIVSQIRNARPSWSWHVVPRVSTIQHGIDLLRADFAGYCFDEEGCKEGLAHLENYKRKWNTRLACWDNEPEHDEHCHAADAIRQKAQGFSPSPRVSHNREDQRSPAALRRRSGLLA